MRSSILTGIAALGLAACGDASSSTSPAPRSPARFETNPAVAATGAVFTETNAVAGNSVVAFSRAADGSLTYAGTFSTGGNGIEMGRAVRNRSRAANDPTETQMATTSKPVRISSDEALELWREYKRTGDAEHRDTIAPRVHDEEEPVRLAIEKKRAL